MGVLRLTGANNASVSTEAFRLEKLGVPVLPGSGD